MCPSLFLVALLFASATSAAAPTAAQGPPPTPPRQADPWEPPPTALPRFFLSATADLFSQGLADPRGCEYRRIVLKVGQVWGGAAEEVEVAGWVLPPAEGADGPRFAVAWNGLVYPVARLGEPADFEADARSIVGHSPEGRRSLLGFHGATSEANAVAQATPLPIRICLLLRLGRADLAETVWERCTGRPPARAGGDDGSGLDLNSHGLSYLSLARDLAWYHFDRAICAHMRGDDPTALADARFLDEFARAVDARAEALGFEQASGPGWATSYIDFLGQLPELLADQERRAREPARPLPELPEPNRESRIAALIRDLDQIAVRQAGQPGGVSLGRSPIVRALVAEGDAAVEPLIRAYREDDRLTRSVGFGRDFIRHRTIPRADQAALEALQGILKVPGLTASGPDGRPPGKQAVADRIEEYWREYGKIPEVERWYRALADDAAGESAWLVAAGQITRPEGRRPLPGREPPDRPRFRGESLRDGREPSVTTLMASRVDLMLRTSGSQRDGLHNPCRMAELLAEWDGAASLPTLRELSRICRERFADPGLLVGFEASGIAASIARLTLDRAEAGDAEAIPEYAAWVRTTSPDRLAHHPEAALEPLRRWPDDPVLAEAAAWLFRDPESPWVPLIGREGTEASSETLGLISSQLVEIPAFRAGILAALDDRTPVGTARIEGMQLRIKLDSGLTVNQGLPREAEDLPAAGTEHTLRRCDAYAWQLARRKGAPSFNPCWDEPRRDEALAAMKAFLDRSPGL